MIGKVIFGSDSGIKMTSYRQPDYDIDLRMSRANFHAIAGVSFDATITFGDSLQGISGMLIVPEGYGFSESGPGATAWLWSEDCIDAPADTKVSVTLGESCNPMLTLEDQKALIAQEGLTFEGVVTRNWNI